MDSEGMNVRPTQLTAIDPKFAAILISSGYLPKKYTSLVVKAIKTGNFAVFVGDGSKALIAGVKKFQKDNNLAQTGKLDRSTKVALNNILKKKSSVHVGDVTIMPTFPVIVKKKKQIPKRK